MHTTPTEPYKGLTIILSKPSRFDEKENRLLSGMAGQWMEDECLGGMSLSSIDIRTPDITTPLLPNTKRVLLCNLNTAPIGYPCIYRSTLAVNVYSPQDCCDHRSMEIDNDDEENDTHSERDTKDDYPTRRYNYRFWTKWHSLKLLRKSNLEPQIKAILYPDYAKIISLLNSIREENLYLDIETSRQHRCLTVIGFSSDSMFPSVCVCPMYRYNGDLAYPAFAEIYKALSYAMLSNTVVIHNASFDLTILHGFYRFPLPSNVYDTMLANHRLFPEAEKSLAHVIAQWTSQNYHKDVSTEVYNANQELKMHMYNARDVYNLKLIKDAQHHYATSDNITNFHPTKKGLVESIAQANDQVIPYLENSLTGLRVDQIKLAETERHLNIARQQYERIVRILIGDINFNPGSTKQCTKFFHDKLHYPVVKKSDKTGLPSLGRKQLYQLRLKHSNPVILPIIKYRKAAKDASMLESPLLTLL